MKMRILLFILVVLYSNLVLSQVKSLSSYVGSFEGGKANYTYYENENYERVYNGNFEFSANVNKYDGLTESISGSFLENQRNGKWIFSVKNVKSPVILLLNSKERAVIQFGIEVHKMSNPSKKEIIDLKEVLMNDGYKAYLSYNSVLSGNYINGKLDGVWTFNENSTGGKVKVLTNIKNSPINSKVLFKDNILIGNFIYKQDEKNYILGQFDANGEIDGKWSVRWVNEDKELENISMFKNGILTNLIERNISTGDIIFRDYHPESEGLKKIIEAVFFWIQIDEEIGFNNLPISKRNYMFKFNRGIVNPKNKSKSDYLNRLLKGQKSDTITTGGEGNDNQAGDNGQRDGDPNAKGYYGTGGTGGGGDYQLGNRKPLNKPKPNYICNEEGIVVVQIEVDRSGNVINATPGVKGTTNSAECLKSEAKIAALKTTWQPDPNATSIQIGYIRYRFSISQ